MQPKGRLCIPRVDRGSGYRGMAGERERWGRETRDSVGVGLVLIEGEAFEVKIRVPAGGCGGSGVRRWERRVEGRDTG